MKVDNFDGKGPWDVYNGGKADDKKKSPPKANKEGNNDALDFDQMVREIQSRLQGFFKKTTPKKGGGAGDIRPFKYLLGILIAIVLWLGSGVYKIEEGENGAVLYFGRFSSVSHPGLNYYIPYPFGQIIKIRVDKVNEEEFKTDTLMLTGDENIIDIEYKVQWKIGDIEKYLFNIKNPNKNLADTIRKASESSIREVIARSSFSDAFSDGKRAIALEATKGLQDVLDEYKSGIEIVGNMQMLATESPLQVKDAFEDVQAAKADNKKLVNDAEKYRESIVPRAEGRAIEVIQQAEAYKKEVVSKSEGEAERFLLVYNQYKNARTITKTRIYLETMEEIYQDMNKTIVDSNLKGIVPYLSLDQVKKRK